MIRSLFLKLLIAVGAAISMNQLLSQLMAQSPAPKMTVHFRSGTLLTGEVTDPSIAWTSVADNGSVSQFNYNIGQIKSLTLSTSKSSAELIRVRQLLIQLGDRDYHKRESAEQQLQAIGGAYRSVLQTFTDHQSFEVRYRLQRLMESFQTSRTADRDFDRITLTDGAIFEGEAADFRLAFRAYGKTISIDRQNVAKLTLGVVETAEKNKAAAKTPVEVQLFHQFQNFVDDRQKEFQFDVQSDGSPMPFKTNLDREYVADGLLLRSEERGYVGASPFSFRYENLPVGGRSAGLLGQQRGRDFKGVMVVEFCQPGNANVPAGVYEIGTFIAKVNFERDIILEAYGAQGQRLATVEATDQKCVFAGVKSNQLITKVRILSNPYLKTIERVIDDDFAIDSLRISTPIPTKVFTASNVQQAVLNNGDVLRWSRMNVTQDSSIRLLIEEISDAPVEMNFPMDDLKSVAFGHSSKTTTGWQGLLDDGSRVNLLPGKPFRSTQFKFDVSADEFVGCWPAVSSPRYPVVGDFQPAVDSQLIVFPTCRLQTGDVQILDDRLAWTVNEKLEQPLQLNRQRSNEDPTPQENSFKYADTLANQLPTVWFRPPTVWGEDRGFIFLTDAQRLMIGDTGRFQLKGVGTRTITVAFDGGVPLDIPLKNVQSIQFP